VNIYFKNISNEIDMNCYPKLNRKKFTAWCEECKSKSTANEHQEKEKHTKIIKTEYLVMEDCYFY
jgi:hypothetical protein